MASADPAHGKFKIFRTIALLFIAGAVIAIVLISSGRMLRRPPSYGDFGVYLNGARLLAAGENIYTTPTEPAASGGLFYIYPPLFALLFVPLTWIPVKIAIISWGIFTVFLVGWVVKASYEILTNSSFFDLPSRSRWIVAFFSILPTARFILHHLDRGQANVLEMALVVLGLRIIAPGLNKSLLGGAVVGVSIALKVLTLPFTVWHLLRNFKAAVGIGLGIAAGLLGPALFLGWTRNLYLLRFWFDNQVLDSSQRESKLNLGYNFSILAQLQRFFSPAIAVEHNGHQYTLMLFQAPTHWIYLADLLIRVGLLGILVLYCLRFRKCSDIVVNGGIALSFAVVPLFFPTAQKNYFVFLLPTYLYVVYLWHRLELQDRWFRGLTIASFCWHP